MKRFKKNKTSLLILLKVKLPPLIPSEIKILSDQLLPLSLLTFTKMESIPHVVMTTPALLEIIFGNLPYPAPGSVNVPPG